MIDIAIWKNTFLQNKAPKLVKMNVSEKIEHCAKFEDESRFTRALRRAQTDLK